MAHYKEGSLQLAEGLFYEYRPIKAMIFAFLIKTHILELKGALEKGQENNNVVPLNLSNKPFFDIASTSGVSLIDVLIDFPNNTFLKIDKRLVPIKIYNKRKFKIIKNRVNPAFALRRSSRLC